MIRINQISNIKNQKWGQSIAEYAILIAAISAALLAMSVYARRGIQSVIRHNVDQFGTQEFMETNATKAPISNSTSTTSAEAEYRTWDIGMDEDFISISTFNESSKASGFSTSVFVDEDPS